MQPGKQEISSTKHKNKQAKRAKKIHRYATLGAIFLFFGIVFGIQALAQDSSRLAADLLLSPQPTHTQGTMTAQINSYEVNAPEKTRLVFIKDTSLLAMVPPMTITPKVLGALLDETTFESTSSREITHYIVEQGDSVASVAEKFEVSVDTILWANDLNKNADIQPGDELVILPVSGALHLIRPGDTLSEVALWYRGNTKDILDLNDLEAPEQIFVGDILIIPNGRKPAVVPNGRLTLLANSYFIYPVPRSYKITQGAHPFNAIDLSNGTCGSPAYAAAGGTVQRAQYNNGYGNYVRILHPNGVVTLYAHLANQAVAVGERVLQGEIIGYVGHSGRTIPAGSAGCHLHFEVRGADNPFAK